MTKREIAMKVIKNMSDEKIESFLCLFADENEIARIETESIANDGGSNSFDNVDDLMKDLLDKEE